jgi:hypothetical protein
MVIVGQGSYMAGPIALCVPLVWAVLGTALDKGRDLDDRDVRGWWPGAGRR